MLLTFEQFKSKLEDESLRSMYEDGLKISRNYDDSKCGCPLSSIAFDLYRFPGPMTAARLWNISDTNAYMFIEGFNAASTGYIDNPYYKLGFAYHKKFILNAEKNR